MVSVGPWAADDTHIKRDLSPVPTSTISELVRIHFKPLSAIGNVVLEENGKGTYLLVGLEMGFYQSWRDAHVRVIPSLSLTSNDGGR